MAPIRDGSSSNVVIKVPDKASGSNISRPANDGDGDATVAEMLL